MRLKKKNEKTLRNLTWETLKRAFGRNSNTILCNTKVFYTAFVVQLSEIKVETMTLTVSYTIRLNKILCYCVLCNEFIRFFEN